MTYEMLVAMNVTDADAYAKYRDAIAPVLSRFGGGFRYDFEVNRTLTVDPVHPVNRVFAIFFEDEVACKNFFVDQAYLSAKQRYYTGAVDGFTVIAEYSR
ncbi:MAG: DUF1330 domain-containing protein [Myxococcota bacterium]